MKVDKNKLGIGEWIIVLALSSLFLYTADYTQNVGSYKSRIINLTLKFLNSNNITYWLLRGILVFIICFSLYKIVKIIIKKK